MEPTKKKHIKFIDVLIILVATFGFPISFLLKSSTNDTSDAISGLLSLTTWFAIAWVVTKIYKKIKEKIHSKKESSDKLKQKIKLSIKNIIKYLIYFSLIALFIFFLFLIGGWIAGLSGTTIIIILLIILILK